MNDVDIFTPVSDKEYRNRRWVSRKYKIIEAFHNQDFMAEFRKFMFVLLIFLSSGFNLVYGILTHNTVVIAMSAISQILIYFVFATEMYGKD